MLEILEMDVRDFDPGVYDWFSRAGRDTDAEQSAHAVKRIPGCADGHLLDDDCANRRVFVRNAKDDKLTMTLKESSVFILRPMGDV